MGANPELINALSTRDCYANVHDMRTDIRLTRRNLVRGKRQTFVWALREEQFGVL